MPSHLTILINVPSEHDCSDCYKAQVNSKWRIFEKTGLHISHLNINSVQPKNDDICYIAKQPNASIAGTRESKLDSSILNGELDIEDKRLRSGGGVACYIRKYLSYNHKPNFCGDTKSIFIDSFLPKSKPILVTLLHWPQNKPEFIEHLDNILKRK